MRRTLNTTNAMPKKYKKEGFSGCVPRTLWRIDNPPQSATAMYAMVDTEKIAIASVIFRAAVADRSMTKKRFDGLLKGAHLRAPSCGRKTSLFHE
jgi:hypothetical protein